MGVCVFEVSMGIFPELLSHKSGFFLDVLDGTIFDYKS